MRIPELLPASLVSASALVLPATSLAGYPTVEEAQRLLCNGQSLSPLDLTLTGEQAREIERLSGDKVRERKLRVWRTGKGGYFFVDRVRGKHEWIVYAAALDRSGHVVGVEILDYRETYGYEVGRKEWQAQFRGKSVAENSMVFDKDIRNISGATISCRNMTRGLRRLSAICRIALASGS